MGALAQNNDQRIRISFLLDFNEYPELACLRDTAGHGARPRKLLQLATRGAVFERELRRRMQGALGLSDDLTSIFLDAIAQDRTDGVLPPVPAQEAVSQDEPPARSPRPAQSAMQQAIQPAPTAREPVTLPVDSSSQAPRAAPLATPGVENQRASEAKKLPLDF